MFDGMLELALVFVLTNSLYNDNKKDKLYCMYCLLSFFICIGWPYNTVSSLLDEGTNHEDTANDSYSCEPDIIPDNTETVGE